MVTIFDRLASNTLSFNLFLEVLCLVSTITLITVAFIVLIIKFPFKQKYCGKKNQNLSNVHLKLILFMFVFFIHALTNTN